MEIVKKNLVSIICGVIALLAVIANFYPLGTYFFEPLKVEGDKRAVLYSQLTQFLNKSRSWPNYVPDSVGAEPLTQFPNPDVIQEAEKQIADVSEQAAGLAQLTLEVNRRDPLMPELLPMPRNDSIALDFRQALHNAVTHLKHDVLKGGVPPTPANIELRAKEIWHDEFEPQQIKSGDKILNETDLEDQFKERTKDLDQRMRDEIVRTKKMYLDNDAMPVSSAIVAPGAATTPTPEDIWYAQVALWVQTDVCQAIADTNEQAPNIRSAVVKRLLKLDVPVGPQIYVPAAQGSGQGRAGVFAKQPNPDDPPPFEPSLTPTGRICNPLYDVVHFDLVVHVDSSRIGLFLKQLSVRRFLTVRQMNVTSVDYAALNHDGFAYGAQPVVQLTMDCEALMMRGWTVPLMPDTVRKALGVVDKSSGFNRGTP